MKVAPYVKTTWAQRWTAFKKAILPLGFPSIVLGSIYTGKASPTEASAMAVLYAFIVEVLIYKNLKIKDIYKIALSTGLVTGVVFILLAMGAVFSWLVGYAKIPDQILPGILGAAPSAIYLMAVISMSYFIACMFVDSIVAIMILSPIFHPMVVANGLDPVLIGILVTMQAAIGAVSPPLRLQHLYGHGRFQAELRQGRQKGLGVFIRFYPECGSGDTLPAHSLVPKRSGFPVIRYSHRPETLSR